MALTLAKSSAVAQRTATKAVARTARVAVAGRRPLRLQAAAQSDKVLRANSVIDATAHFATGYGMTSTCSLSTHSAQATSRQLALVA